MAVDARRFLEILLIPVSETDEDRAGVLDRYRDQVLREAAEQIRDIVPLNGRRCEKKAVRAALKYTADLIDPEVEE